MSDTLRVALVTRSLMMGGAQNHIVKLCNELNPHDVSISICLLINDEPDDLIRELPSHIRVYVCPYKRHDIRTVFWLASTIKQEKSQLVHSFLWHADFYSSLLKILLPGIIVVASERGDRSPRSFQKWFHRWIDRLLVFPLADGFCANSHFGQRLLISRGCEEKKIRVIHNGVNLASIDAQRTVSTRALYNWPETSAICCIVSRLVDYKGIDSFVKLVKFCKEDIRFIILGDGPERQHLTSLIAELTLNDRVVLAGQHNPATPYIKSADLCALPTRDSEHCSNSLLEYMACAKPVVAVDVGGNSELIISGQTGFLVAPSQMGEIPAFLDRLAANEELSKQIGLASRRRIEELFQMGDVAKKFLLLWEEFLDCRGVNAA